MTRPRMIEPSMIEPSTIEPSMTRPLLLGHRGARGLKSIAENTVESFDRALADGCDGFEFDVRLTADGVPVICHDPNAGGVDIAQTPAQQMPHLPRLPEVLTRYKEAFLDIELKVPGLEAITADLLRQHEPRRGFVVSSFLPEVLEAVHAESSRIPLGLICEAKAELQRWCRLPVEYVIPHHTLVQQDLIAELHASGKKALVWTVNTAAAIRRFSDWGVDGIISDHTKLLGASLR